MAAGFVALFDMKGLRPLLAVLLAGSAFAHPMGNLSVNHYARLEPGAGVVHVTYVIDLAEIPTFELTQTWNVPRDAPKTVLNRKAAAQARDWVAGLTFTENGKALKPTIDHAELSVIDGAGNLPVFHIVTKLHFAAKGGRLEYEDHNYPTRAGWREVVIQPAGGADVIKASVGAADISDALTSYPQDPTKAPPQDTSAWFQWTTSAAPVTQARPPAVQIPPAVVEQPRDVRPPEAPSRGTVKRNDAISTILRMKTISWPLMTTLIGLAFWFGALHAFEPGHGKTMVAAYLVGSRGTPKHAALLGGMVTLTHTVSVFFLGLVTMFLSRYIMPDKISKVLGIISGLTIVWIGAMLLWKRSRRVDAHHHHEDVGHTHSHGSHTHTHGSDTHSHVSEGDISFGSLAALGASGGLVPCPSALILLLSAISIGRVGLGMILLIAFSLGLALVLMATGMAVLFAKNLFPERKKKDTAFFRYMPILSAAVILVIGVVMTSVSLGWIAPSRFFG